MTSMHPVVWFIVALFLFILSHLLVDKEFDQTAKIGGMAVIGIISVLYIIFGVF